MKKILPSIGIIALLMILEISWSGFFSLEERSYFFLFSFLGLSVLQKGFLRALPMNVMTLIIFEGVICSTIGPISLYGLLFSYGMSFLLKRVHLEYGGEKFFLALAVGIGMAFYPPFAFWFTHSFRGFPPMISFPWSFIQNVFIGAIVFLVMLRVFSRFRQEQIPFSNSFLK